eukprot:IDg5170t1
MSRVHTDRETSAKRNSRERATLHLAKLKMSFHRRVISGADGGGGQFAPQ